MKIMNEGNKLIYERDYILKNGAYYPLLEISLKDNESKIEVLADTGCNGGLVLLKTQISDLNLGEKISEDQYEVCVADGHILGADVYKSTLKINEEEEEITILVINNDKILRIEEPSESFIVMGREYLDNFNVIFQGVEKKIYIYYPI